MNNPSHTPPAATSDDLTINRVCKVCERSYAPVDPKQKYCSRECKRDYEKVLSQLLSDIRTPLLVAVDSLIKLRK